MSDKKYNIRLLPHGKQIKVIDLACNNDFQKTFVQRLRFPF